MTVDTQAIIVQSLIDDGFVEQVGDELRLTDKGNNEVQRWLMKYSIGKTIMLGLHYTEKFGVPIGNH
ncbi:hypothetical protein [Paenibacillus naphthalenovorans]|uniref:hypothetical protein n=1 Tax=Paenibacillus naphthalenovorans TaxID=162209 RepID=UPI00088566B9|nr:hypothetical protein [Paenibacillus naphthalenovorans]SDI50029.1 hypothetical protein SAMN05421868_10751 [Paenibacillus naphthalenovorans]